MIKPGVNILANLPASSNFIQASGLVKSIRNGIVNFQADFVKDRKTNQWQLLDYPCAVSAKLELSEQLENFVIEDNKVTFFQVWSNKLEYFLPGEYGFQIAACKIADQLQCEHFGALVIKFSDGEQNEVYQVIPRHKRNCKEACCGY